MTNENEITPPPKVAAFLNQYQMAVVAVQNQFEGAHKMALCQLELEGDWQWTGVAFKRVETPQPEPGLPKQGA